MERKLAVITGADGGMGTEITRAVALAGYRVIMACCNREKAEAKREWLVKETGNPEVEVMYIDLASLASVADFAERLCARGERLALLMNNAGTMETGRRLTEDGLERTVSVNYVGPYLLTRKLLPLMEEGSRVVNMVSCTYAIGRLDFPAFFLRGKKGSFFRPFIRTPRQGAATAIGLLLDEEAGKRTGTLNVSGRAVRLSGKYLPHVQQQELWERTEEIVRKWL